MDTTASNFTGIGSDSSFATAGIMGYTSTMPATMPTLSMLVALFSGWVILCVSLRFRRINNLQKRLGYTDRASLARMTNDDANIILRNMVEFEFPKFYTLALQFAIFKTYGIETISKLIVATKNLANPQNASKRYEDTTVLFREFSLNPPASERCIRAISRMNYLHSRYVASGQISNADLLYTLAVCVAEPPRFMRLYEWRPLTDMEVCAIGTHWKAIGDAMGIQYKGYLKQDSWADGLEFADDISAWAKQYEMEVMRPSKYNQMGSALLVDMLLWPVPRFALPFARQALTVLMGDLVREAFCFTEPEMPAILTVYAALVLRRFVVRYLSLPRFFPVLYFSEPHSKTGRIVHYDYLVDPWYNPANFWSRWGPVAIATRLMGGLVPGPEKLMPQGFLFEDIGPKYTMGKGTEEMAANMEELKTHKRGGCPFSA